MRKKEIDRIFDNVTRDTGLKLVFTEDTRFVFSPEDLAFLLKMIYEKNRYKFRRLEN